MLGSACLAVSSSMELGACNRVESEAVGDARAFDETYLPALVEKLVSSLR